MSSSRCVIGQLSLFKGGLSCKKPKIFLKFFSIVQNVQTLKTIFLNFFLPLFEQEKSSKTVAVLAH